MSLTPLAGTGTGTGPGDWLSGAGNDHLLGGLGNDGYLLDAGGGSDVIDNAAGPSEPGDVLLGAVEDRLKDCIAVKMSWSSNNAYGTIASDIEWRVAA